MKEKRSFRPLYIIGSCALVLIVLFALLPFGVTKEFDESDYSYALDYFAELDGIPVFSQETEYTCYAVSPCLKTEQAV
jgi:hypothetical protein